MANGDAEKRKRKEIKPEVHNLSLSSKSDNIGEGAVFGWGG